MNQTMKKVLEFVGVFIVTAVIAMSSPFNPWLQGEFTAIQEEILDVSHSVREGYLASVELDGHYGPVLSEFFGLGYLPTETHVVHFIMEIIVVFVSVLFIYKTAKLYTSEIFSLVTAIIITVFGWGSFTHAGAEELLFFILTLTAYHVARQLKFGFLSYHTYLLTIDLGLVFFLQPGYSIIWMILLIFFAVKFKVDNIDREDYKAFYFSLFEGLVTVSIPMGLYLLYFKNASAFFQQVVVYNFANLGSFAEGLTTVCGTPWILIGAVFLFVIVLKALGGNDVVDLYCWLGFMFISFVVMALQGDNLDSTVQFSKVLYTVPLASLFSFLDKPLGLRVEERKF